MGYNEYVLKRDRVTITDGSAVLTGLLLGFNLPSNLPIWIILIGALVAIGIGKMTFGGLGCNPFNPALVGRVFLLVSFPVQMTTWPVPGQMAAYLDAETGATPLARHEGSHPRAETLPCSKGYRTPSTCSSADRGMLGRGERLGLLIGLAYMLARRIVTYAREDEDCYIDEHMGFIKFGSRVDLFLPVGTKVNVKLGQKTVGNETIIAKL